MLSNATHSFFPHSDPHFRIVVVIVVVVVVVVVVVSEQ